MSVRKTKQPAVRGQSRSAPASRATQSTTRDVEESEFFTNAWNMEVEAVERYSMLADAMEAHNNPEVAELFRKLARIEQLHADNILEHDRSLRPEQAIAAAKNLWQGSEAPETADPGELHYRMQPYHALKMALAGEQKARDFFEKIARETSSASVRKQALEMAEEEAEHVRLMEDWISRTPAPDEDWAYDPDPPASPD